MLGQLNPMSLVVRLQRKLGPLLNIEAGPIPLKTSVSGSVLGWVKPPLRQP